jgi:selenide,water dikinase
MGNGTGIISTTDFLAHSRRPIHFGRIAATNALSDVYGEKTINAIAILGWPIDKLALVAAQVMEGRKACADAGITLPVVIVLIIQNLFLD